MTKKYTDYARCENGIDLRAGISDQDFLTVLCWDYEAAARFVLDWANTDTEAATSFITNFLWRVLNELHIFSSPMTRKDPDQPGLQTPGTSVCSVAFQRFCELLRENPDFIRRIQQTPPYSSLEKSEDFLSLRETNWVSLTRDIHWQAAGTFKDPEPIQQSTRAAFHRQRQIQEEEDRAKRVTEARAREDARQAKKRESLRRATATQEVNKQKSKQRRALRDAFLSKSVHEKLESLATDTHTRLTAFPFNPCDVSDDALTELDDELLGRLHERVAKRWEAWWKEFAERIGTIRNHRTRG